MSATRIAPPVTIVSSDTNLLCDTAWNLTALGYQVSTSSDWSVNAIWKSAASDRIVLLDGRDSEEVDDWFSAPRNSSTSIQIVIRPAAQSKLTKKYLAAGADDIIDYPINACELLARLRCAVRQLEFERRFRSTGGRDAKTRAMTKWGFVRYLERQLTITSPAVTSELLLVSLDNVDEIAARHGQQAIDSITAVLTRSLAEHFGAGKFAVLGECRFAVAIFDGSGAETRALAQRVMQAANDSNVEHGTPRFVPSVTALIHPIIHDRPVEQQLESGLDMLLNGRSFGGNILLEFEKLSETIEAWKSRMESGGPFEQVAALHIMEAFCVHIPHDRMRSASQLYQWAVESKQPHCIPPCLPVVDRDDVVIGVLSTTSLSATSQSSLREADLMSPLPASVRHDQPIHEVFDAFAQHDCDLLMVNEGSRPVGFVTRESLASLVADPIDTLTYYRDIDDYASTRDLVVPLEAPLKAPSVQLSANSTYYDESPSIA